MFAAPASRDAAERHATLLRMKGHEVTVVNNGRKALDALLTMQPDIALLDIGMPQTNGYDVARQVRSKSGREVILIAITGWGRQSDRDRAHRRGV